MSKKSEEAAELAARQEEMLKARNESLENMDKLKIEELPTNPDNVAMAADPGSDDDDFAPVVENSFTIQEWAAGVQLIGRFTGVTVKHTLTNKDGSPKQMLEFRTFPGGHRVLADLNFKLNDVLVNKNIETPVDWDNRPIFRITNTGKKDIGGGQTLLMFTFEVKYSHKG
jgi:hypothetical protein